jgi:hypothetical protein
VSTIHQFLGFLWPEQLLRSVAIGTWIGVALTRRIESVNINGEVNGFGSTNTISDFLNDTIHTNGINLSGLDDLEATVSVIFIITRTTQSGSDTGMDVSVISEQPLLRGMVKVCSMVDASYFARGASKYFWLPCIKMRIEVDDGDGTVCAVDGSQKGECDCVVSTQCDDSR